VTTHPIEQVLGALNTAGVRYLVVGGVAVVLHGHLRTTADLDLVVSLDPENARRAVEAIGALGYRPRAPVPAERFAVREEREAWIADKGLTVFSFWSERASGLEIDLFLRESFDFEAAWARRVTVALDTTTATVVSLQDLLALKRAAKRPQDAADIEALEAIAVREGSR
jgi:predicted nucleotidyltransferase